MDEMPNGYGDGLEKRTGPVEGARHEANDRVGVTADSKASEPRRAAVERSGLGHNTGTR
jgi:hypothetical protein